MSVEPYDERTILNLLRSHSFRFWLFVSSLAAIVAWGVYVFYLTYVYGLGLTGDRIPVVWGLNIIDFVYFIAISMSGTIISGVLRLSNAPWRGPITRIAESITVAALPIGALFPMLDLGRPERAGNLLIFARLQSPIAWDMIAIGTYFIGSVIYFYLPLIPDLAICRDSLNNISRLRAWFYRVFSLRWAGRTDQEDRLKSAIKIMAVLIVPIAVCVHSVLAWVFAVTFRVDMHSTVFPILFVAGAVYSGLATILIVLVAFRKFYHLEQYIEVKHVLYLAYIFFASDLFMIYLTVTEYLTSAWTAETADVQYIASVLTGAYAPYFWFMIVGGFILPALIIALPQTRTLGFIVVGGLFALAGMWIERYLFVVPSLAVPELPYPTGIFVPSWEDISMTAAGLAGFILLLVLVTRLFPVVSLWELNERSEVATSKIPSIVVAAPSKVARGTDPNGKGQEIGEGRRHFLKTGLFAAVVLGIGLTATRLSIPGIHLDGVKNSVTQPRALMSSLGEVVSLQQVRSKASFPVSAPTWLPEGTELNEARITANGGMVALLCAGGSLKPLQFYEKDVGIVIFQIKEDVINSPPSFLPSGFERTTVQGSPGFYQEPLANRGQPGQLQWWSGGRRISMFANLSGSELTKIASSMEVGVGA